MSDDASASEGPSAPEELPELLGDPEEERADDDTVRAEQAGTPLLHDPGAPEI